MHSQQSIASSHQRESLTERRTSRMKLSSKLPNQELERHAEKYSRRSDFDEYLPDIFEESTIMPDLAIQCQKCKSLVFLPDLKDHQELHESLAWLDFKELPNSLQILYDKRKHLIKACFNKYMKNKEEANPSEWNSKIARINSAFELVKSYLNNTFEINRQIKNGITKFDVRGESRLVSNNSIAAIGACSYQNKPTRVAMEDSDLVLENFGENSNLTYVGVFDGYDGDVASMRCADQLHLAMLNYFELNKSELPQGGQLVNFNKERFNFDEINNLEKFDTTSQTSNDRKTTKSGKSSLSKRTRSSKSYYGSIAEIEVSQCEFTEEEVKLNDSYRDSFKHAYKQMDKLLLRGRDETSRKRWSGATACTCLIENRDNNDTWIHVANCGDVEAIVVFDASKAKKTATKKNYHVLTRLHTLEDCVKDRANLERSRDCHLTKLSSGKLAIEGLYEITRGLGFHGDRSVKKHILSTPSFRSYKAESVDFCLIIATKGLWKVLGYEKVAQLVLQTLPNHQIPFIKDRPTSPSVKQLVRQYYHNRDKEKKQKDKAALHKNPNLPDFTEETEEIRDINTADLKTVSDSLPSTSRSSLTNQTSVTTGSSRSAISSATLAATAATAEPRFKLEPTRTEEFYTRKHRRPQTVPHEILRYSDEANDSEEEDEENEKNNRADSPNSQKYYDTEIANIENNPSVIEQNQTDRSQQETESRIEESVVQQSRLTTITNGESEKDKSSADQILDDNNDVIISSRNGPSREQGAETQLSQQTGLSSSENPDDVVIKEDKRLDFKSFSDSGHANQRHYLNNQKRDLRIDLSMLRDNLNKGDMKIRMQNEADEAEEIKKQLQFEQMKKDNEIALNKLKSINAKGVQVSDYELNKYYRKCMIDQKAAKRLEYAEMLAERLVTSALLAGADDNITINCVLLSSGCSFLN